MCPMRTMKLTLLCLSVFVAASASAAAPPPAAPAAPAADPAVAQILEKAFGLLGERLFEQAAKDFKQADELAGGSCGPCLLGLSRAYTGLHKPEKAADAAREAAGLL